MKLTISTLAIAVSIVGHAAFAEDEIITAGLCEKMQSCTLQQMQDDDAPAQVLEMVKAMYSQQCVAMSQVYAKATKANGLHHKASKCIKSLAELSCDKLLDEAATPQCEEFEKSVNTLGGEYE